MKNVYTVNSDALNDFNQGDELDTPEKVVSYYVALYLLGTDPPADLRSQLSDEEILKIVEHVEGEGKDADGARYEKLVQAVKVKPTISATGDKARAIGVLLGKSLPAAFDDVMLKVLQAKDITDSRIIDLAIKIDTALPRTGNGKINLPFPGSVEVEKIKGEDGIEREYRLENYDRWAVKDASGRRVGSVYKDAFLQRDEGDAIQKTLDQIDIPATADKEIRHADGTVTTIDEFREMTPKSRASARIQWNQKLNYGAQGLRDAVSLLLHLESLPDRVEVYLATQPKAGAPEIKLAGKIVCPAGFVPIKSTKPIILVDAANKASATEPLSLRTFMGMVVTGGINDPHSIVTTNPKVIPHAVGSDASMQALVDTNRRQRETGGSTSAKSEANNVAQIPAGNVNVLQDYCTAIDNWTGETANWVAILQASDKNKLPIELLLSMDDIAERFSAITGKHEKAINAHRAAVQAESERVAQERAEKLARTG